MDGLERTSSGQNTEAAKCFICHNKSINRIKITAESKHTKTRFSIFVQKFLNDNKSERIVNDDLDGEMLCDKCANKIDEYDWACSTAERVAKELCEILRKGKHTLGKQVDGNNHSENVEILEVKPEITEVKVDCSLVDEFLDGNDFIDFDHTSTDKGDSDAEEKSLREKRSRQNSPKNEPNIMKNDSNSFNATLETKLSPVSIKNDITNQKRNALENENFQCEICEKIFGRKKYLARHMRLHTNQNVKMTCEICGKEFIYKWSLKLHMQIHANFMEYSCECGKRFNRRDKMLEHRKTHDKTKERVTKKDPYECSDCSATFGILKEFKVTILVNV